MKQKYEVYLRESSITVNNHLKPIEVVECDGMLYDGCGIEFFVSTPERYVAVYNWDDIIKVVRLS